MLDRGITANLRSWNKFKLNFAFDHLVSTACTNQVSFCDQCYEFCQESLQNVWKALQPGARSYRTAEGHDSSEAVWSKRYWMSLSQLPPALREKSPLYQAWDCSENCAYEWAGCMINELFRFVCFLPFETCHSKLFKESLCHGLSFFVNAFTNWLSFNFYISFSLSPQKNNRKRKNQTSLKCLNQK